MEVQGTWRISECLESLNFSSWWILKKGAKVISFRCKVETLLPASSTLDCRTGIKAFTRIFFLVQMLEINGNLLYHWMDLIPLCIILTHHGPVFKHAKQTTHSNHYNSTHNPPKSIASKIYRWCFLGRWWYAQKTERYTLFIHSYRNRYDSDHISYTYRSYRIIHVILFVMQLSIDVFRKRSSSTLCLHQIHLNIESTHAMLDVVTNGHDLHRMERTIHLQKYKDLAPGTWRCLTDFCWLVGCLVDGFILHYTSLTSYHRIPICYLNSLPRTCLGWALMLWCHLLQSQPSSWRVGEVSIAWMPRFNGTNRFFTKRFLRNLLSTSNQRELKLFNYSTRRIVEDQCKYSKYYLISKM